MADEIRVQVTSDVKNAKKELDDYTSKVKNMAKVTNTQINAIIRKQDALTKSQKRMDKVLGNVKKGFNFNALGIMFFGQAMKRVSDSIMKSSQKTFQDTQHSVEGNVTAFDRLDTSFKKIQYSMGSVFESVISFFLPAFTALADTIKANPALFAGLTIALDTLGTILAVGGALNLGLAAMEGYFKIGGLLQTGLPKVADSISKLNIGVRTLKGLVAGGLIIAIGMKLFNLATNETPATALEWAQLLGMAGIVGWTIGGLPGAFISMAIVATLTIAEESVKSVLQTATDTQKAIQQIMTEGISYAEAFDIATGSNTYQGTSTYALQQAQAAQAASTLSSIGTLDTSASNPYNINIDNITLVLDGSSISDSTSGSILSNITSFS